jgi:hypothetical protein
MPFIWNTNPNPPPQVPPFVIGSDEITYKAHVVANAVNAGGELSYNTPNVGFDIVYELDSLNVRNLRVTTLNGSQLTINTATINTASINRATINTANFTNVFIQYGFMGGDPTSNLQIATKHYVDIQSANVPAGGSDLQNIINARGDLLVGIAANTAARLPVGSNGQILIADSTSNTGLRWATVAGLTSFNNLWIQTHYNLAVKNHQVLLRQADEIIMNDGSRVAGWSNLVADITVSGAGGLDIGVEEPSHWYEVYALHDSSNDVVSLVLHRAPETLLDQSLVTTTDNGRNVRNAAGGESKIAQSFVPLVAGPLTSVEVEVSRVGSPTGLIWVTLETDDANNVGFPSGNVLATSRVMDVARLPTDKARMRFLFDTNTSVSLSTTYHLVYQGDYTVSGVNYTTIWGIAAGGYTNGRANEFRIPTSTWRRCTDSGGPADLWFKTFVKGTPATEVVLPVNYDQWCHISYVYNNSAGHFKPYVQKNRKIVASVSSDWRAFTAVTGLIEAVDLGTFVPPVPCAVQFYLWTAHASPNVPSPIGGVSSTDMLITGGTSVGSVTANVKGPSVTTRGVSVGPYNYMVVEDQVILARMQNVDSRLYSVAVSF